MSDYERLSEQLKGLLSIKLDGHIEACVLAATYMNIGLTEAANLAALALLRELSARGFDREATEAILSNAVDQTYFKPAAERPRMVS